jgi:glucosyl-3-phosphoglycerate synthase
LSSSPLHRISHLRYDVANVAERRQYSATVCVPTRDEEATIQRTVEVLVALRRAGVIDRVVVADDSTDQTPKLAEAAGAEVVRQHELQSSFGPVLGKGDAMWRALTVCTEDVVCFVDGDSTDFGAQMPCGLIGAVAVDGFSFAKGTYRRPFLDTQGWLPAGGGRVTELTAKPLLRQLFPPLGAFTQPLSGEIAARTDLLRRLPLATGYAVDVALLIDVWRDQGIERMVEVDLDTRQNRHRPLAELAETAVEVSAAILSRAGVELPPGPVPPLIDRPPLVPAGANSLSS